VTPSYVYYQLFYKYTCGETERFQTATTNIRNLNFRKYSAETIIDLAPRPEQERIVAAIEEEFSRLDAGVAALERARQNLNRMRASLLRAELYCPEEPEVSIRDIATAIQYGYTAKATMSPGGPKMLRITDIQDGAVNWRSVPYCAISPSDIDKFRLAPGDLVFARTGATVGKSFLIREVPEAVFASYLIRLRFQESVIPAYIALFFQSQEYWRQVSEGSLGIGQPNVNGTTLGRVTLRLPGIKEQERVVLAISDIDQELALTRALMNQQIRRTQFLRASILAAAFSGKLVPQDPADEPASDLLRQIEAERGSSNRLNSKRASNFRISREVKA
jgi:hypothetical protein